MYPYNGSFVDGGGLGPQFDGDLFVAASLGYMVLQQQDSVGLAMFELLVFARRYVATTRPDW